MHHVLVLVVASMLVTLASAQDPPTPATSGATAATAAPMKAVPRDSLRIAYYRPTRDTIDLNELEQAASRLFCRRLLVTASGEQPTQLLSIQRVGNALAIVDAPAEVERVLAALPELELRAFGADEPHSLAGDAIRQQLYTVETSRLQLVMQALEMFRRKVPTNDGNGSVVNISSTGKDTIIVRDTKENLARISEIIDDLGAGGSRNAKAAPPVLLSCMLVVAGEGAKGRKPVDAALAAELRRLLPYEDFGIAAVALAQVAAPAPQVALPLQGDSGMTGILRLRDCRIAAGPDRLAIDGLSFAIQIPAGTPDTPAAALELETRADIAFGEDVVIGAIGRSPHFLVLRATRR